MMMGFGWGSGAGGGIAMAIFWVGLVALLVWVVTRVTWGSSGRDHADAGRQREETSEQTLDRRFAVGEIDEAQYQTMRETLYSGHSRHQSHN